MQQQRDDASFGLRETNDSDEVVHGGSSVEVEPMLIIYDALALDWWYAGWLHAQANGVVFSACFFAVMFGKFIFELKFSLKQKLFTCIPIDGIS